MATNMTFVDFVTPVPADWLNNVNSFVHTSQPVYVFNVKTYGAVGNGVTDDSNAILAALAAASAAGGGVVQFPAGTYKITKTLFVPANTTLQGFSKFSTTIIAANNTTTFTGGNPNAMIMLNANNSSVENLTIDGNMNNNTSGVYVAIGQSQPTTNLIIQNCTIQNSINTSILLLPNSATTQNVIIRNNTILNSGWDGIDCFACVNFLVEGNTVISAGGNGILTGYAAGINSNIAQHGRITNNYVNKATPPTHILAGNPETGFMIVNGAGDSHILVDHNDLYDNRHAAQDGLGLGQDGTSVNENLVWANNNITYAGLYGLDMSSNHIAIGNYIRYSAQQGIKFGTDVGGNLVNSTCAHNIVDSCNLAGTGTTEGIWVAATLTGALPSALYANIKITGNRVVDYNATPHTIFGLGIGFQNNLVYSNCDFSDNDFSELAGVNGIAFHTTGTGSNFVGWTWKNNKHPQGMPVIFGATPNIMGLDAAVMLNAGATNVTDLLGKYDGKEIIIQHQTGNTTYVTPVMNKTAGGNTTAAAASIYRFISYGGVWYYNQFY